MFDESPLVFEQPIWLFLLLLIVPAFLMSLRSIGGLSRTKAYVTFAFRTLVIVLLTMALAHPRWEKRGEGVTVTIILDRSLSVPWQLKQSSVEFLHQASNFKDTSEDQVAVITVAKDAAISTMAGPNSGVSAGAEPGDLTATNLAEGVRLAMAIMPDDTANRIVIASDGNETMDSVLAAAELARANGVPIDVLLLEYEHANEVIFDRLVTPARVRQGQSADVRMVVRTQKPTTGRLFLSMNDEPLDLDPDAPGDYIEVELDSGRPFVLPVTMSMDRTGPQRFNAYIETDDDGDIPDNNRAVGVTFVGGEGRVLVVDDDPAETVNLVRAIIEAGIDVDRLSPDELLGGLVQLTGYDAIVLANLPRHAFDDEQDRLFHAYVHDLGGGLIMLGGEHAFGAGGWIDSQTARVLPVDLDPPSIQQMPRGALALIMHSCEMPQGNFWGQKLAQSAIEALSRLDYCGIVEYNWGGGSGSSWAYPMQIVGDKVAAIAATKQMVMGDMPDFASSMQVALAGFQAIPRAGQKHTIIISDGDPSPPGKALLQKFVDNKITVTTIMVGGHGTPMDRSKMKNVADTTGGTFYNVTNPKNLPQIFIKEAQIVSRSLIQEDTFFPAIASRLPGPAEGYDGVPPIEGYVLTAPRKGLAQTTIVIPTSEGKDPLYAHWNYGLGKSIAYTSDLRGKWGINWVGWSDFKAFWEQSVRWAMRPASPSNMTINTRVDGDVAVVEMEALDVDAGFMNFLNANAVVVTPDGETLPLALQQTGPGRYRGEFRTHAAGAYLVNVNYAGADDQSGNLQAAVSVPYSEEYRSTKHNAALLKELVDRTGGRTLEATDPQLVGLFERGSLEVPRSHRRIWDLLAMIAAGLFLLDVASRRLAVDPKWLRGLAGRAVSKRSEKSEDTVAAWKRMKKQAGKGDKPKDKVVAAQRFRATEDDAAAAIDVGGETPGDIRKKQGNAARETAPKKDETPDEGQYTSRLLQAKRRARGDDESEGENG